MYETLSYMGMQWREQAQLKVHEALQKNVQALSDDVGVLDTYLGAVRAAIASGVLCKYILHTLPLCVPLLHCRRYAMYVCVCIRMYTYIRQTDRQTDRPIPYIILT